MGFLDEPIIYPTSPSHAARDRLRTLIQRAKTAADHDDSLRIACIGDSTLTSPGGAGVALHHALTNRLGRLFGNIAGGPKLSSQSDSAPFNAVNLLNQQALQGSFNSTYYPMGFTPFACPFTGEGASAPYQPTAKMQILATQALWSLRKHTLETVLFPTDDISLEIVGIKQANSAPGFLVIWAPTNGRVLSLLSTQVANEIVSPVGIDDENDGVIELTDRYRTTLRTPAAGYEPQWYIRSSEATTVGAGSVYPPAIGYMRFLNNNPIGCMLDLIGGGGYSTNTVIGASAEVGSSNHANSIPYFAQMRYDIMIFGFSNDVYTDVWDADDQMINTYNPGGSQNDGLVGEIINECEARGITVPLFVFAVPPFRDQNWLGWTQEKRDQHELLAEKFQALADTLNAAGYYAIVLNVFRHTWEQGFTEARNTLFGLTDRGAYSTAGVAYAVDDYYSHTDGSYHRCILAHTSSSATEITDAYGGHTPLRNHLSDEVHRSAEGGEVEADAYAYLFQQHFEETTSSSSVQGSIGTAGSLIRLVRGADYKAINGRAIAFSFTKIDNIATPGSAVCRFIITKRYDATETLTKTGTLSLLDATTHKASFDIADTDTSSLALGDYEYRVEVVDDSSNIIVPIFSDRQRLMRLIDN